MLQDDDRPVVQAGPVVVGDDHRARQRGVHSGARWCPHVDGQVHRPALGRRVGRVGGRERRRGVEQPGLGVAADPDGLGVDTRGCAHELVETVRLRVDVAGAERRAAHRQVGRERDDLRPRTPQERCRRRRGQEPAHDGTVRVRVQAARVTQPVVGEPGVHGAHGAQRGPGTVLAHPQVRVVGALRRLDSRVAHAHRQPGLHQVPHDRELVRLERQLGVEPCDHRGDGLQRVGRADRDVRPGDRGLGDLHRVHEVAVVEQPAHAHETVLRLCRVAVVDQHVVVVGVAVHHRGPQPRQHRYDPAQRVGEHRVDDRAVLGVRDRGAPLPQHLDHPCDVPVEVAVGRRVVVAGQGARVPAQQPAQVVQERGRGRVDGGERNPGEPVEQPYDVPVDQRVHGAVDGAVQPLHREPGGPGQLGRAVLRGEDVQRLGAVGDLQDVGGGPVDVEPPVLVTLAGQRVRRRLDAVDRARDIAGTVRRECGGVLQQRHPRTLRPTPVSAGRARTGTRCPGPSCP